MKKNIFVIFAAALVFCACGSSKKVVSDTTTSSTSSITNTAGPSNTTAAPSSSSTTKPAAPAVKQFVSDLDIAISYGKEQVDLGGKLSARRDDVIRINLSYMGFIEVATIEFTPDYLLFMNRINKSYTKAGYKDLDVLVKNNITFETMQETIWAKYDSTRGMKFDDKALSKSLEDLFNSKVKSGNKASVNIKIGEPNTTRSFSSRTEVKSSYKEIPADVLFSTLTGLIK